MKLLSDGYLEALREKNARKPFTGTQGRYAGAVVQRVLKGDRVLDFGCAHQALKTQLEFLQPSVRVVGYDPAIPSLSEFPDGKFDIIVATDVLEHIEPEYIADTLKLFDQRCTRAMFFVIGTVETGKKLSNGYDHHLIVQSRQAWEAWFAQMLPRWRYVFEGENKKDFVCWLLHE